MDRRNSLKARPPPMKRDDPYYPGNDRRYEDLSEEQIPLTESLMDCMERGEFWVWRRSSVAVAIISLCDVYRILTLHLRTARPLWEYGIRKEIEQGNTVLVVAHTNTLRGLMKVIDREFVRLDSVR